MSKFDVERFTACLDPVERHLLLDALAAGYQLTGDAVTGNLAPCVVILASYARRCLDMELVDDFDALVVAQQAAFLKYCHHPDLFLASCICLLHSRGEQPDVESFRSVGIDELFDQLVATEEEES